MKSAEGSVDEEQSCQRVVSHEWCEVSLKIDRATVVSMSRRGVREHSTKRIDGIFHRPCTTHHNTPTSTARAGALMFHLPGWSITRVGPGQHPRYTRADFGQEAVGGSTTTTRARKRHATRDTQCEQQVCRSPERGCGRRVVNTETGGDRTAWQRNKNTRNMVAELCCESSSTW